MKVLRLCLLISLSGCWNFQLDAEFREPHYRIAFIEEQLNGIRNLPEQEQFLLLSYTDMVNADYYWIVNEVIIAETTLSRWKEEGVPDTDPKVVEKVEQISRYKENLGRETERFLSYAEMEARIGKKALERVAKSDYTGLLRWDYYNIVRDELETAELMNMREEDLFLYLRDRGPVNRGYRRLVDDMVNKLSVLNNLKSEWTDTDEAGYIRAEKELENIKHGLRNESQRILKMRAFLAGNSERALIKAQEELQKETEEKPGRA